MCGIAGLLSLKTDKRINKKHLLKLNRHMTRRGPDDSGFWYSSCGQIGLAHNRLSIVDPGVRSNQPMTYMQGRYLITYNGEIYNYKALQSQLIKKGYRFSTQSDTEVIMAMYDCFGKQMLDQLRGMFSFAIWDNQEQELFAARDPFGIKPFYYTLVNNEFIFSSSVKAIAGLPSLPLTDSAAGWCGFILHGSVPEPFTVHDQIRSLPAGYYLVVGKNTKLSTASYYSIFDDYTNIQSSGDAQVNFELMAHNLEQSVTDHLVADVPVGLFLSSGIDSNVIAYHAKDHPKLVAFTLDFEEFGDHQNESKLAVSSAKNLGIEHQILKFGVDHSENFLEDFFQAMDQPSIDGLNVWMISKAVSEQGFKAVLSGLGGDELFAGYPSFKDVPRFEAVLNLANKLKLSSRSLEKASRVFPRLSHPKISGFGLSNSNSLYGAYKLKRNLYLDEDLNHYFDSAFIKSGMQELQSTEEKTLNQLKEITNPYLQVSALEMDNYMKNQLLRDADWASMSHSLELRVPFVDRQLIHCCAQEIAQTKHPQKSRLMKKMIFNSLPNEIFTKKKTGFETPVKRWLTSMPEFQNWKSKTHLRDSKTPWARRWAHEVKSRFLN